MLTLDSGAPYATVIIPTRNGLPLVEGCFRAVLKQVTPWPFEVVVIDSGSTDGTWELVESLPVVRIRIQPDNFNHGATRNLGAERARGKFLVFLVQDAIPYDEYWLANLVSAADSPNVAGSYSKQIVRPESNPITQYLCKGSTPCGDLREIQALPIGKSLADLKPKEQFQLALFQNASSCVRKSVWSNHPFAAIPYGEDIEWGKRVIESGYSIVYEPTSVVYHSHDRSAFYALKRAYADHWLVNQLFGLNMAPSLWAVLRTWGWRTREAWCAVARSSVPIWSKFWYSWLVPVFTLAIAIGEFLGIRFRWWLPKCNLLRFLDRWLREGV